jgi:hypothetical protein
MDVFVEKMLDHPDLTIESYRDRYGIFFYVGASQKYEPKNARGRTADSCFLKFDIPLWAQKEIAAFIKKS